MGNWHDDALVVATNNLRDSGWLDARASPLTDQVRIIERSRRPSCGKLEIDITIEDATADTKRGSAVLTADSSRRS